MQEIVEARRTATRFGQKARKLPVETRKRSEADRGYKSAKIELAKLIKELMVFAELNNDAWSLPYELLQKKVKGAPSPH